MPRRNVTVAAGLALLGLAMVGLAQITGGRADDVHPLGTEVVVGHASAEARTQIALTVLAVRTGTQEELAAAGFVLDGDEERGTPYYVDARYENRGPEAVERTLRVGLVDDDGDLVPPTLLIALVDLPFPQCPAADEGTLEPGEAYESCTLVLVPEGIEPRRVEFLSDNGPGREPEFVYWEIE